MSRGSTYGISQPKAPSKATEVEIVELEDEDGDEIEIVGEHCEQVDDDEIIPVMLDESNIDTINGDIECIEVVEVGENHHIKSFKPRNYKWMESSPLYQPQVLLLNSLNLQMKSADELCLDVEDAPDKANDVVDANDIIIVDDMIEVEGSPVKQSTSHIRKLFVDEEIVSSKRTTEVISSPRKRRRQEDDEVELLMIEEEDDESSDEKNELMDIQSMLEVTMEEESTEADSDSVGVCEEEKEILEVDLESEEPSEDVEVLCVDEQDNIVFNTVEVLTGNDSESNTETRNPKSIKDLVTQWAREGESLTTKTSEVGKMGFKKRRKDLKPKPC